MLILQDNELWGIVNNTSANPIIVPIVAADKAAFDEQDIKAKRIIFYAIKTM